MSCILDACVSFSVGFCYTRVPQICRFVVFFILGRDYVHTCKLSDCHQKVFATAKCIYGSFVEINPHSLNNTNSSFAANPIHIKADLGTSNVQCAIRPSSFFVGRVLIVTEASSRLNLSPHTTTNKNQNLCHPPSTWSSPLTIPPIL